MRKFLENKKNSHGPYSTYSVTEIYDLQRFNIKSNDGNQKQKKETSNTEKNVNDSFGLLRRVDKKSKQRCLITNK